MPYQFTITDANRDTTTVTVAGPNADLDAIEFAHSYRISHDHTYTVTDPVPVDAARTDDDQPDANRPVADGAGGEPVRGGGVQQDEDVGVCFLCGRTACICNRDPR